MESNHLNSISIDIPNYSGPLETLLDLAKNQKVDLASISVTMLADEFLEFIKKYKDKNLDLAFEYLLMATWLTYLKSKLLLPEDEDDKFKASEIADKLKLQLKKLELIRLLSDQILKKERIGRDMFYRGTKGGIRSIYNPVYKVTLYELLKTYAEMKTQSSFQKIDIPKLPVMTTQEGIKQIKENMTTISEWKKIEQLIPKSFTESKRFKKTGLAAIFTASLELTKDGIIDLMQKKLFDDVLIRTAKHTPMKLREK
ncbi:MAG: segregation/condensation protein A [Candidatus Marinimicrobia bacterium]|nr:segregation/condensation protein A [Candidatus Neomarinimicrobiota bacterium]|tara:strand:- start:9607 stop:10374 length:768 start_codon:yes stop_codon:yes gene_type:complete